MLAAPHLLKAIHFFISIDDRHFTLFTGLGIPVFHTQDTVKSFFVYILEKVFIIDLSCGWLIPAGIISYLEVSNLLPGLLDVG
jgi:hypothetical protein